jgi:hypothetical protein
MLASAGRRPGGLDKGKHVDWCRSDEETGEKPYPDMEHATESKVADTEGSTATCAPL